MRGLSFQIGRFFGVEVRIHAYFLLLLALFVGAGSLGGFSSTRMLALWCMLLLAVIVREIARSMAAAWLGLELRSILLLPTGGLITYATIDATERAAQPAMQRRMAVIGPLASMGFGILLAAIIYTVAPGVGLLAKPWIIPSHLLRSMVWLNLLLGAVNLLPAFPLDAGRVFRSGLGNGQSKTEAGTSGLKPARGTQLGLGAGLTSKSSTILGGGLGQAIAIALVVAGLLMVQVWLSVWLIVIGAFVLIGAHMENQGLLVQSEVETVLMRDVMLTQFSTLSASDTLEDALQRAVHTLQDVFPVVRGVNLVGAVSRQNIVEALATEGNSYVQGVMTKSFQTALPSDSLVKTLRRIMGGQGAQLVPVMEGERIVGIVTPQNLSLSMGLLSQGRRMMRRDEEA